MQKIIYESVKIRHHTKFLSKLFSTSRKSSNSFNDFIRRRQAEAKRSIVVQVNSENSYNELYNYCKSFGTIIGAHHYQVLHEDNSHYILLEYASNDEANAALNTAAYNDEQSGVPVYSPFLWFKAAKSKRISKENAKKTPDLPLNIVDGTKVLDSSELNNLMQTASDLESQMQLLYQCTKLNDLGVRLRFLATLQIEKALSGMFPTTNALPFGSSVNGFGKMGCDLDMILRFDDQTLPARECSDSRLIFHTKENHSNGRSQTQRHMENIGDMLHLFIPGVNHVRRILQARVPIIKYHHEHLNLEVDLSMSNLSGFYMSEILYMFGELDERVRPLIFCIRRWASVCGLTNPSPGRWISNFSLTCIVVFFLQQIKNPILPNINALMKAATEQDIRVTEDGINCTFARNLNQIGFRSQNTSKVSELLLQFFEFYSQFDFQNRAISLNEGRALTKPDHSAMYIVNPLEQTLNVSKNVSLEECERLKIEVRNAAWVIESEVENTRMPENEKLETQWGLLSLFKSPEKSIIRPNYFFKPRMVEVSDLFESEEGPLTPKKLDTESSANVDKGTSTTPPMVESSVDYKNDSIKHQVQQIKTQTRSELNKLRMKAASGNSNNGVTTPKGRRSR